MCTGTATTGTSTVQYYLPGSGKLVYLVPVLDLRIPVLVSYRLPAVLDLSGTTYTGTDTVPNLANTGTGTLDLVPCVPVPLPQVPVLCSTICRVRSIWYTVPSELSTAGGKL